MKPPIKVDIQKIQEDAIEYQLNDEIIDETLKDSADFIVQLFQAAKLINEPLMMFVWLWHGEPCALVNISIDYNGELKIENGFHSTRLYESKSRVIVHKDELEWLIKQNLAKKVLKCLNRRNIKQRKRMRKLIKQQEKTKGMARVLKDYDALKVEC